MLLQLEALALCPLEARTNQLLFASSYINICLFRLNYAGYLWYGSLLLMRNDL